jgi:hypothetical protein
MYRTETAVSRRSSDGVYKTCSGSEEHPDLRKISVSCCWEDFKTILELVVEEKLIAGRRGNSAVSIEYDSDNGNRYRRTPKTLF